MRSSLLLTLPLLVVAFSACQYDDSDDPYYGDDYGTGYGSCSDTPLRGTIDTDAAFEVDAATGVGLFVEYQQGGRWLLYTTCDTDVSDFACSFDIIVKPVGSSPILALYPDDLELADDSVTLFGEDTVEFLATTDIDTDGVFIDTDPGVAISVDVLLDGDCANDFVYWVGDGATHAGAPTNPFEFEPNAP